MRKLLLRLLERLHVNALVELHDADRLSRAFAKQVHDYVFPMPTTAMVWADYSALQDIRDIEEARTAKIRERVVRLKVWLYRIGGRRA